MRILYLLKTRLLPVVFLFMLYPHALMSQHTSLKNLQDQIDQLVEEPQYENAFWGIKVINLDTDEVLYDRNEKRSMMPASNGKLYTIAAALDILGPSYRYETPFYTDGPITNGVLKGNLIVRGSGDPTIGARYDDEDPTQVLRTIVNTLKNGGLRVIEGDIIGDDDIFDNAPLGIGWSWDDQPYYYSAEVSALSLYDNSLRFILEGQDEGQPAALRWDPLQTSYATVHNKTLSISADSSLDSEYERHRTENIFNVKSLVPSGRIDTTFIAVVNPTRYFVHVLRELLIDEGIAILGNVVDVDDLTLKPQYDQRMLRQRAVYTSPPLHEVIKILNKESQNLYAELLIRTIGAHFPVDDDEIEPGSAEMGVAAAMQTFARARMDTSRISLVDGSGLSRMNLVTADMTANLLSYMWNHPYETVQQAFYESMPIGGVDGTLERRFRSGPGYRNIRAKTGTLTGASSLSGYVDSANGVPLLVVLMCNNYTHKTSEVRKTQDKIILLLASFSL